MVCLSLNRGNNRKVYIFWCISVSKMANLKAIVDELAQNYQAQRDNIPGVEILEKEIYTMSGIERNDPHTLILAQIDSPHLKHIGSACGVIGNKVFSKEQLMGFLKEKNVEYVVGIIYDPKFEGEESIGLNSVALPIAEKDAEAFEELVSDLDGSFRYEDSRLKGWSVYESE
jgi:hypothetical protein